jgi:hypothetical protein
LSLNGTAVFFVEKEYFDDERKLRETRKRKREAEKAVKKSQGIAAAPLSSKRLRVVSPPAPATNAVVQDTTASAAFLLDVEHHANEERGEEGSDIEMDDETMHTTMLIGAPITPMPNGTSGAATGSCTPAGTGVQDADTLHVEAEHLRNRYALRSVPLRAGRIKKQELEPVLDDVINAKERGIKCRKVPILAALEDDKSGLSFAETFSYIQRLIV